MTERDVRRRIARIFDDHPHDVHIDGAHIDVVFVSRDRPPAKPAQYTALLDVAADWATRGRFDSAAG